MAEKEKFYFEVPSIGRKKDALDYIKEFYDYNSNINGVGGLNRYVFDYEGWLEKLEEDYTREPNEEKVEEGIFPYEVQKDIIVFGGHDTWLKTFRQLLKGKIKYVDKELNFDPTIVRYADAIWIQPNAISHAQYYKIVDAARKYKKPIRYFQYASAAKCAEQIVIDDN